MARRPCARQNLCMRRLAILLLPTLLLIACPWDSAWLLPEKDAITIAHAEFAKRGIQVNDTTHMLQNINVCTGPGDAGCTTVSFTLDGWDPAQNIGFEYLSSDDPDFGMGTLFSEIKQSEALQSAVDKSLAGRATVLIIHQWSHETETLCREQFTAQLGARLDAIH